MQGDVEFAAAASFDNLIKDKSKTHTCKVENSGWNTFRSKEEATHEYLVLESIFARSRG